MSALPSLTIEKDLQPSLQEEVYVHDVYNEIAPHFSQTRYKPWPIVETFLKNRPKYSIGLDVGCGNGKYLNVSEDLFIIGTDRSSGLIQCGQEISKNQYNLGIADGLSLPHPNNMFDFAISIAVIHHFANENRRVQAIQHILSKLKQKGQCLIYCWALEQENSRRGYKEGDEQDILIPWVLKKNQKKAVKKGNGKLHNDNCNDRKILGNDAKLDEDEEQDPPEETKYRYYHLYKKGEIAENALATKACKIVDQGYEKDNWWIIIEKI
ncbi:TRM9 [Candida jiufengensis]|uniref:TRM9 n=1 Tax=Candida jiufengensis TaxID=497108 RepID=UPI0022243EB1|nr:TRM9 [Candida jiufengensis]KAI5957099.1 TRM9 [Candida jiufengensis]